MKYLIRALKYFVYLTLILCLVIFILVKTGVVEAELSEMFVHGYDSLWQIAIIIAVFAGIYPHLGYSTKDFLTGGPDEDIVPGIKEVMEDRGYKLESESPESLSFIKRSPLTRAFKMWEDRVTFTRKLGGYAIEGLTKDIVRVASALDFKFNVPPEDA